MTDHRQDYTPTKLYVNGQRMLDRYTVDDAVDEYMAMHPDADRAVVRTEIAAEIDENLIRSELTDAQRADHHTRRERILVAKGLVAPGVRGGDKSKRQNVVSYSLQAANSLGVDQRTVQRDLSRGKKIAPEVLAEAAGTELDKGVVLDQLRGRERVTAELRINSMADYTPARLYAASWKWHDVGYTVDEAVAAYMRLHPDADEREVRAEIEMAGAV